MGVTHKVLKLVAVDVEACQGSERGEAANLAQAVVRDIQLLQLGQARPGLRLSIDEEVGGDVQNLQLRHLCVYV